MGARGCVTDPSKSKLHWGSEGVYQRFPRGSAFFSDRERYSTKRTYALVVLAREQARSRSHPLTHLQITYKKAMFTMNAWCYVFCRLHESVTHAPRIRLNRHFVAVFLADDVHKSAMYVPVTKSKEDYPLI